MAILDLISGTLDPVSAVEEGEIEVSGDLAALADFPTLFEPKSTANEPSKSECA